MKTELVISSLNIFDYENTFASVKPKTFVYRDYKTFSHESFKNDSMSKTVDENVDFSKFEKEFIDTLNKQAPKKTKQTKPVKLQILLNRDLSRGCLVYIF